MQIVHASIVFTLHCRQRLEHVSSSVSSSLNTYIVELSNWSIYLIGISKCARMKRREEGMPSQPAPAPLTFQQAAEYLRPLRDFGLFTNQRQFIASICQAEELRETGQCSKANCFKQTTRDAFCLKESGDFR